MFSFNPPYGLAWKIGFGISPEWTVEPDLVAMENLARHHLDLPYNSSIRCTVTYLSEGANNKVYKVETTNDTFVMRVGLPLDMPFKVESEVATCDFLRELSIPTPNVLAYDPTNDNQLRFPWMLVEMVNGEPAKGMADWRDIPMIKRKRLVKQLAQFHSRLFYYRFSTIGSLIYSPNYERQTQDHVRRATSLDFFFADEATPRGPFETDIQWLYARLHDARARQVSQFQPNGPEALWHNQQRMLNFTDRVIRCIPRLFSAPNEHNLAKTPSESWSNAMILFAADLLWGNMLIDDEADLVAYIDWEFVSTAPCWAACRLPKIFNERNYEEPFKEDYPPELDDGTPMPNPNGEVNDMYWFDLMDYQCMVLRDIDLAEMATLNPAWMREYREGAVKREFLELVLSAEKAYIFNGYEWDWLEKVEKEESTNGVLDGLHRENDDLFGG
ncbi:hypothetical protein I316_07318 [Kwoniella heveanensis BCC8398]|uniref:Aminoglycoside phosphotransferase domain-containing protein n=1 Tax=Kwoniella heveanensis BCC8398 TaxID=1296120 RepID=A0A1B9GJA5_9TREE|nr:hypothetical protein I316_07318 [Kwoniella heveanensis BCC8398]